MATTLFKKKVQAEKKAKEVPFKPEGQRLLNGSVRYSIGVDRKVDPSGVFWSKDVPKGAKKEDYLAAQAKRDEVLKQLRELCGTCKAS